MFLLECHSIQALATVRGRLKKGNPGFQGSSRGKKDSIERFFLGRKRKFARKQGTDPTEGFSGEKSADVIQARFSLFFRLPWKIRLLLGPDAGSEFTHEILTPFCVPFVFSLLFPRHGEHKTKASPVIWLTKHKHLPLNTPLISPTHTSLALLLSHSSLATFLGTTFQNTFLITTETRPTNTHHAFL